MEGFKDLNYPWPANIVEYEAKLFFGLAPQEAIAVGIAFMVPLAASPGVLGFFAGSLLAAVVLLSMRRFDRMGGVSIVTYVVARLAERRRENRLDVPLIVSSAARARIVVEDLDGNPLLELE